MNYDKYFRYGNTDRKNLDAFTSDNTERLGVGQVKERLLELAYIQEELQGWGH